MKHNYHSHTPWSHHCSISPEDSIKKAIELGFKTWGFSEHTFQKGSSASFRMNNFKEVQGFVKEVSGLKEKYKDQIDIKIGLEFDYRHDDTGEIQIDFLRKTLKKFPEIEYVLYAPHFYDTYRHTFEVYPTKEEIKKLIKDMREALSSFNFAYIVHSDAFVKGMGSWTKDAEFLAKEIIQVSLDFNIPLGLNANGLAYTDVYSYPSKEFWTLASKMGAIGILELDSHLSRALSQERIDGIKKIAKETKIKLIDKLDI